MDSERALDAAVRLEVYRFFVDRGRPPVPAEVAETVRTDQASVEDSLRRLAEAHVLVLAPGTPYVWMAKPLSAIPTPFQVGRSALLWQLPLGRAWGRRDAGRGGNGDHLVSRLPRADVGHGRAEPPRFGRGRGALRGARRPLVG